MLSALVLIVLLAITYRLWLAAEESAEQDLRKDFESRVLDVDNRIEQRMRAYTQVLRGFQGLYANTTDVTRDAFHTYDNALHLDQDYPGIQGVGFAQVVPSSEKDRLVSRIRKQGFPEFNIWPKGQRDLYTPIIYIEPFIGDNLRPFGYDMHTEPARRTAMEQARDNDDAALSSRLKLVADISKTGKAGESARTGFKLFLPVYKIGGPHDTLAERRANLTGWVYALFRADDLMRGILGNSADDLSIEIYDGEEMASSNRIFDSNSLHHFSQNTSQTTTSRFQNISKRDISNATWTIAIRSLPALEAHLDRAKSRLIAVFGVAVSLLLALLTWLLATGRERALAIANIMTQELRESENRFRQMTYDLLKTEVSLRVSEERWQFALEGAGEGVWDWNPQTDEANYSRIWKEMLGYAEHELSNTGAAWLELLHPGDKDRVLNLVQDYFSNESVPYIAEFRMRCKDGSWKWILARGKLVARDEEGKPLRMIGTHSDITHSKHTEDALKSSEERLKLAIASGKVGIWEYNPQTEELFWDDIMYALYGENSESFKVTCDGWLARLHPEDRAKNETAFHNAIEGIGTYSPEFRIIWPDGEVHYIKGHAQILRDEAGKPIRFIGTNWDNWAHAHTQQQLELAFTAIDKSKTAFFWVTPQGKVSHANEYACQSLGYSLEELVRLYIWDFDPDFPPEAVGPTWADVKQHGMRLIETRHKRKDGTIFPVEVSANYLNEEYNFCSVQDITERKQAEAREHRLTQLYKALSEVNQAIVRMEQQSELFPLVCRCAVEFGGLRMAFIALLSDEASGLMVADARYGSNLEYLDGVVISSRADVVEGRGSCGTAFREGRPVIINDYFSDPMTLPWRKRGMDCGWSAVGAFPIQRGGKPYAVLNVFHEQLNAFDAEVIALLVEMSKDISFALDNFDRETARKAGEDSQRLAASVYETSSEAMMVMNADRKIIAINPAFTEITGYLETEVLGKDSSILKSEEHDQALYDEMWDQADTAGKWQGEIWDKRKNGDIYPKWLTINTIFNERGSAQHYVALFTDITERKQAEQTIWQQANYDRLTGLPNRQMFHDRMDQEIKKSHRASLPLALLFLDLDRFKEINDTLGHDMGDILLIETAKRLTSCVRETDTVARLGGDEFTIILGELDDSRNVERVTEDILRKLSSPFQLGNDMAYVSASIGITLYPEDASTADALLKNADQAMYAAKNQGRNRYHYFTPSMQKTAQSRMRIANDLRKALAAQQFRVYYQPIVDLQTGDINKAEALIRWEHPKRGLVGPVEFISIAEETGLIVDIGAWVFHQAANQVKSWRKSHHPGFQISVNKSPVQFHNQDSSYPSWTIHLDSLGLPGQSIVVEITEGLLLDTGTHVIDRLQEFRAGGIEISLDDFGTGYSSLSYLNKFDIDFLKIDQSFVRNLASGSSNMALCEAIIVMAHKLGMQVIAEGIETEQQRDLLTAAGCDYGQGYLFSKPIPAEQFEELLINQESQSQAHLRFDA
ncbi:MAG TPA: EAL domain-containing protein [Methylophilaceae bacterium]